MSCQHALNHDRIDLKRIIDTELLQTDDNKLYVTNVSEKPRKDGSDINDRSSGIALPVSPSVREKVFRAIENMEDETIAFLKTLVECGSVLGEEGTAQGIVRDKMRDLDLDLDVFEADLGEIRRHREYSSVEVSLEKGYANRPNVIGKLSGSGGGRSLIVHAHIDTVPIGLKEAWKHNPMGEFDGGRLYGRGACDHKCGIAQFLMATAGIIKAGTELGGDLTLMSTIEEEAGGAGGALACVLRGYSADAAIYPGGSSSGLDRIAIASSGELCFRLRVSGKTVHVAKAHLGVNAIAKMMKICNALTELDADRGTTVRDALIERDFLESGLSPRSTNLVIGTTKGGEGLSTVPGTCEIECGIGFPPGETLESVRTQILDCITRLSGADIWLKDHPPEMTWFGIRANPSSVRPDNPIVRVAQDCIQDMSGRRPVLVGGSAVSDTRFFTLYANTPSIEIGGCLGSGGHIADEWIDTRDLVNATKALALIILEWCGGG